MNSTKTRDWVSIGANLGILAGLILVAVQINQNTRTTRDAAYQSWVAASIELNMQATDTDVSRTLSRGHDDSANLTEETQIQYVLAAGENFPFVADEKVTARRPRTGRGG